MFEDILKSINKLRHINSEQNYKALLRGDTSKSNYCRGFDDALSNIEIEIYEADRQYADWLGDKKCQ